MGGGRKSSSQWISLWSLLLRDGRFRDDVIRLGVRFVKKSNSINVKVARDVLVPLSEDRRLYYDVEDEIIRWVHNNVRSDTVWATLFINSFRHGASEDLFKIGLQWLDDLGGNLSQWIEIWHLFRAKVSDQDYILLGMGWLSRARKDMRAWVAVFFELFDDFDLKRNKDLFRLGVDWLESNQGNSFNRRRVSQALSYMGAL